MKDEAGTKITYTGFRVEDPEKYDYGNICLTAKDYLRADRDPPT